VALHGGDHLRRNGVAHEFGGGSGEHGVGQAVMGGSGPGGRRSPARGCFCMGCRMVSRWTGDGVCEGRGSVFGKVRWK
jgi:hypothetical protein